MFSVYRGDTFEFPFKAKKNHKLIAGTTVKCGIKTTEDEDKYLLLSSIVIENDTDAITFVFKPEETQKLVPSDELELMGLSYILEVEVTRPDGYRKTAYQNKIKIARDYIHD